MITLNGVNPSCEDDPRFKDGNAFLDEKKFDKAVDFFSDLLSSQIEKHGEMSLECAPIYYKYGNAIVRGVEVRKSSI